MRFSSSTFFVSVLTCRGTPRSANLLVTQGVLNHVVYSTNGNDECCDVVLLDEQLPPDELAHLMLIILTGGRCESPTSLLIPEI